ncbi:MAG: response regulator [Verrucomicrobiae bacterium]|nr:response regulator [Verrucomicrobiae bacterium]
MNLHELIMKNPPDRQHPGENRPVAPRILLAEDDPGIRRACGRALARAGYTVRVAADGQEAWEALEMETFDLLVTDNRMPRLSGQELVLKVRQHSLELPVIVAASDLEFFVNPDNEWLQIAQLLQKPFGLQQLRAAVKRCLPVGR